MNWCNPQWLLSRLLDRCGITDPKAKAEFAAHVSTGFALSWMFGFWGSGIWTVWTCIDEFAVDGWKGKSQGYDTLIDLVSKLAGPVGYVMWRFYA
jgi:hypothetical protein